MPNAWMTQDEQDCLAKYAASCQWGRGDIIEIGTFTGGATEILANNAPDNVMIWTIDIYNNDLPLYAKYEDYDPKVLYNKYFKDLPNVFLIVGDSVKIGKQFTEPVQLLLIDGMHGFTAAYNDWGAWANNMVNDGVVIFHDAMDVGKIYDAVNGEKLSGHEGVNRAVNTIINMGDFRLVEHVDTMAVLRKRYMEVPSPAEIVAEIIK